MNVPKPLDKLEDLVFDIGDRIHLLFLSPFFFRESGYNDIKKNREMIKDYIDNIPFIF